MKVPAVLFLLSLIQVLVVARSAEEVRPHAVFVIGTPHYNPGSTLPPLAEQLEKHYGFRCTVIEPDYNPEKNLAGIDGLEKLESADVAVFFLRFLTLPDDQLAFLQKYLQSGKPVVGIRTTTHAFSYPMGHKNEIWNNGFGQKAMGSRYFIHGQGPTTVLAETGQSHPILTGLTLPSQAAGTLYLSNIPDDAVSILRGSGKFKKTGKVTNIFGTHTIQPEMTDDIAWVWENEWGGRVFGTTIGHPKTLTDAQWVRFFINGIHWAAGKPVPSKDSPVTPLQDGIPVNYQYDH